MTDDQKPAADGPASGDTAEPTLPGDEGLGGYRASGYGPLTSTGGDDEPTLPDSPGVDGGPTVWLDEPTVGTDDETTLAVVSDEPTTTGPTVAGWPLDQFEEPPPTELVWQPETPPAETLAVRRSPAYYVALGAAVVLVVGLVALAALVSVVRPKEAVAGSGSAAVPQIPAASSEAPPPTTSTSTTQAQKGPFSELAAHPLSAGTTRMPDVTCELPRFDPADDKQAAFYTAAKKCADDAWRPILQASQLDGAVQVVAVTGAVQTQSCGDLAPTSAPTECDGTVYMTPAYLRDTEQLGRYPGKYLGIFLREYARALQFTTGIEQLVAAVTSGSAADLDTRVDQQATCLAGVASGAMSGRGDVDANITGEIRQRLTTVDAPPDAGSLLDKGFQQRTPAACNTWAS
jgi:hypothetical protein